MKDSCLLAIVISFAIALTIGIFAGSARTTIKDLHKSKNITVEYVRSDNCTTRVILRLYEKAPKTNIYTVLSETYPNRPDTNDIHFLSVEE